MTVVAIMGFVVLYEATIHDSRAARWATVHDPTVVQLGWDPRASTPGRVDRLFRQRESDRANTGTVVPSLVRESSDTTPQAVDDPKPAAPDDAPAVPSELPVVDVDPAVLDQAPAAPDVTGATTDTSAPAPDSAPLN